MVVVQTSKSSENNGGGNENPMRSIRIEKLILNIGVRDPVAEVEKAYRLLEKLTGKKPVKTRATKRARTFGIRKGLPIGVKITLRGKDAENLLRELLKAVDNKLRASCFDDEGNINFGIREYLDIPGIKYDPTIGIFGMNVSVRLERPGFRVKFRRLRRSKIGKAHRIKKHEAMDFMKQKFNVVVEG